MDNNKIYHDLNTAVVKLELIVNMIENGENSEEMPLSFLTSEAKKSVGQIKKIIGLNLLASKENLS